MIWLKFFVLTVFEYTSLLASAYIIYYAIAFIVTRKVNMCSSCALKSECLEGQCLAGSYFRLNQPPYRPLNVDAKECSGLKKIIQEQEPKDLGKWQFVIKDCKYCAVRPKTENEKEMPLRVCGWVDKYYSKTDPTLVIGGEPWLFRLHSCKIGFLFRWLVRSVISHELEHCRQEAPERRLLSKRWSPDLNWISYNSLWFRSELPALAAAPASTFTFLFLISWPAAVFSVINHFCK